MTTTEFYELLCKCTQKRLAKHGVSLALNLLAISSLVRGPEPSVLITHSLSQSAVLWQFSSCVSVTMTTSHSFIQATTDTSNSLTDQWFFIVVIHVLWFRLHPHTLSLTGKHQTLIGLSFKNSSETFSHSKFALPEL